MKKTCKSITAFILSLAVLAGNAVNILPDSNVLTAKAADISASVAQGKDESFYDAETGTLHLKGYVRNSSASDGIILPDGASRETVKNIVAEEGTVLPENCHCLFYGFSNILSVDLKNADASDVTDMSGMFSFNTAPKYIDAKEYNNPWYDFWKADVPWLERIVKIDVAGLDTGKVTNMSGMFSNIYIEPLNLSSFDTSNVTDMSGMFYKCVLRNALNLSCFDTSNVTDMQSMFCDCLIDSVDLSSFDTGNVTNMRNMFWHSNFDTLDLSSFDTGNVTDMCSMFCECYGIESLDLSNFDTSNVTDMSHMFELCTNLTTLNINGFDTYNVTSMSSMFNSSSVKSLDLSSFDTSNVTDMSWMFSDCSLLENIIAGDKWSTESVTDDNKMFFSCESLKGGAGTVYDENNIGIKYAHVDGGNDNPGYLTLSNKDTDESYFDAKTGTLHLKGYIINNTSNYSYLSLPKGVSEEEVIHIVAEEGTVFPKDCSSLFYNLSRLKTADLRNADTSSVTNMADMFAMNSDSQNVGFIDEYGPIYDPWEDTLTEVNMSGWDTSNVTNMNGMFYNRWNLLKLDMSGWDTSNVTDMSFMFDGCNSIEAIDVSSFDTGNVTNMTRMFKDCWDISSLDLSGFDTSNVTDMYSMFYRCYDLGEIDIRGWDTSNVTDMGKLFSWCNSLEKIELSNLDTGNVEDMSELFCACGICYIPSLDLSFMDTSSARRMDYMFYRNYGLTSLDLSSWDMSNVSNMDEMFSECDNLETLNISGWNTKNAHSMNRMFNGCVKLRALDLSGFNTDNVEDMNEMFSWCRSLKSLDLSSFDTSSVYDMSEMFSGCSELETITVSNLWSTFNAYGEDMFDSCVKLVGGSGTVYDYSHRDTEYARIDGGADKPGYFTLTDKYDYESYFDAETGTLHLKGNVKNSAGGTGVILPAGTDNEAVRKIVAEEGTVLPADCYNFCYDLPNLVSVNLKNADTSNVTKIGWMFHDCQAESIDLGSFDTSNITRMYGVFEGCSNLVSLDLRSFDTSKVVSMNCMFDGCSKLRSLDLSSFDTSNVNDMMGMFANCESLGSLDLSGFTVGNDTDTRYMLYDCSALEPGICIVKGNSVTLDGSIGVNVYIQPCEKLAKVIMSGPDGNREYTDFTGVKQSSGDYKFTYPVNATQGNEQITLKAYDKDGNRLIICDKYYGLCNHSQVECTVYGYISKLKKSDNYSDEMLAILVDGLENYCKAAENYFNGADNTISGIDNVTVGSVSEYATNLGDDVKISLVLNSTVALRFYTDSNDVLIDGKKATAKYKDGKKYYEISNISAQQLCTSHKITIDGTDHSCSALSYVHRVLNNPDSKDNKLLTDMAKAAYIYAKAAMAYVTH